MSRMHNRRALIMFMLTWIMTISSTTSFQLKGMETIRMQLLLDDIHPIYLTVEKEGDQLTGKYIFLSSGTEFALEGHSIDNQWRLREIDAQNQQSGWIIGRWKDECFSGRWYNRNRTLQRGIKGCDDLALHARDNKRYRFFKGTGESGLFQMGLYRLAGDQLILKWWSADQQVWATYRGLCEAPFCEELTLVRQDPIKQTAPDSISLRTKTGGCEVFYWKGEKNSGWMECTLVKEIPLEVTSYADYYGTFDMVYPTEIPASLEEQLHTSASRWEEELRQRGDSLLSVFDGFAVSRRMDQAAYGWLDIDWWNEDIISGRMYCIRTYGSTIVLPILFDLEEEEMITSNSLFRIKEDRIEDQLFHWWTQATEPHCLMEGEQYCEWLRSTDRLYIGLQPTGITLSNTFNSLYGKHTSTIRYEQIEEYLKGNKRLWHRLRE